jgi:hypothetical protein
VKDDLQQSLRNLLSLHGLQHGEYFEYFILRATGLLVFVRVVSFHTASVVSRHTHRISGRAKRLFRQPRCSGGPGEE